MSAPEAKDVTGFFDAVREKPIPTIPGRPSVARAFWDKRVTCPACLNEVGGASDGTPLPHLCLRIPGDPHGRGHFVSCEGAPGNDDGLAGTETGGAA